MTGHTVQTRIVRVLLLVGLVVGLRGLMMVEPPVAHAQQSPFLITPYYGAKSITAYFDHDTRANYISVYDGRTANYWNGVCGYIGGQPWAYYTQPNSQGDCLWYDSHNGTDFNLSYERVLAAASGRVVYAEWRNPYDREQGLGLYVEIEHANGYVTRYGHMSTVMEKPNEYTYVDASDIIGTSGNTGVSTGPHLHFEVRYNGTATDPFGGTGSSWLWVDGQWAGHPLPSPAEAESITIDDGDAGFSKGCISSQSCPYWHYDNQRGYNSDHWYTQGELAPDYWARWRPNISEGIYEVRVHVPDQGPQRRAETTWWARYTIYGTPINGVSTVFVDQRGVSEDQAIGRTDGWVSLGTHFLSDSASVKITDETESWDYLRYIGADAVRFVRLAPTYLPDARGSGGWNSDIVVRSNGGDAFVCVSFYDSSGERRCMASSSAVPARGVWIKDISSWCSHDVRSAVVVASQDVSVVVENHNSSSGRTYAYNGVTAGSSADPTFEQTGTTLYTPSFYNNIWGWDSTVKVMNTGSTTANVQIQFKGRSGYSDATRTYNVSPNSNSKTSANSEFRV